MAKKSAGAATVATIRKLLVPGVVVLALVAYGLGWRLPTSDAAAAPIAVADLQAPPADSDQLVVVSADGAGTTEATLQAFERRNGAWVSVFGPMDALIGRSGFRTKADRKEGDGSTPSGTYTLTEAFGNAPDPGTRLPFRPVGPWDYWVNDSRRPDIYNTWQTYPGGNPPWTAEHLRTYGRSYDYSVVIDYNRGTDMVPGKGSAIFLHVENGKPTSGCVSIEREALADIMRWLDPTKRPRITMDTADRLLKVKEGPPVTAGVTGGLRQITPTRVLDTRTGLGAPGPVPAKSTIDLALGGTVPADAVAVALNLTLTEQTEPTYLTVYPAPASDAQGPPLVSNVNARPGEHRANLVLVGLGAGGRVRIYNLTGRAHVVADVVGYVSPTAAGRFLPISPVRVLDSRYEKGRPGTEKLGPGESVDVSVAFAPATASAAVVNVTATEPTQDTFLAAYQGHTAWRDTSTVNTAGGETSANLAIVPIDPGTRTIAVRNANGRSHVVADVQGFIVTDASQFTTAQTPVRVLDTREGIGSRGRLPAGGLISVPVKGLPGNATAVAVTITAVDAGADTYIRATGAADTSSRSSNVNLRTGETRANLAIVPVDSTGRITLTTHSGSVHLVMDVSGWFAPAA